MTLGRLLEDLDAGVLRPLATPAGAQVRVGGPQLHGSDSDLPIDPGAVVLAVGVGVESRLALDLVRRAGFEGAAGVVFAYDDTRESTQELLGAATDGGVAVLGVDPDVSWDQLYRLLRAAANRTGDVLEGSVAAVRAGDLFALANAIAAMAGGPVTIEDPQSRVLAYSSLGDPIDRFRRGAILRRETSPKWKERLRAAGVFRALQTSDEPALVDAFTEEGMRPRMAVGIRAGSELLGSIWVAQKEEPLGEDAARVLKEAARVAALHVVAYRAGHDIDRRRRAQQLELLLEGRVSAEAVAEGLGLDPEAAHVVIAFALPPASDEAYAALQLARVLSVVTSYWEAFRRRAACAMVAGAVYALLPFEPHVGRDRLLSMTADVVRHVEGALGVTIRAGIGSSVSALADVPRSRDEADLVLHVMRSEDRQVAGDVERLRGRILLLKVEKLLRANPHLLTGKLDRLVRHDADHGTAYVATLGGYLAAFGDVVTAADAMSVHRKTFRYRLRRAIELSGIDLDDPDERLVTQLQTRCR